VSDGACDGAPVHGGRERAVQRLGHTPGIEGRERARVGRQVRGAVHDQFRDAGERRTGLALEVEAFGRRLAAEVAPDVLYDPQGKRLRN